MSGLSLTLFWPDDELEALWVAPADAPAYRRLVQPPAAERQLRAIGDRAVNRETTEASRGLAKVAVVALDSAARAVHAHERELGDLDAVAGDGDHGTGMRRGTDGAVEAARSALERGAGVNELLVSAGQEWSERAGGTSGAVWSAALMSLGSSLGDKEAYSPDDLVEGVARAIQAVVALGGAQVGDKTMVDAMYPFAEALKSGLAAGSTVGRALQLAGAEAARAAAATAPLRPRKGRARPLADRSVGTPDPGAVSFALVVAAVAEDLANGPVI
jgi:dihydroxyacetone kinase